MTPLLFPHTYLSPVTADAAAHFFSQLTIYQPVDGYLPDDLIPWVNTGFLKVHVPVPDDGDRVAAAVKDFQQWARQHLPGKNLRNILPRAVEPRPPFFGDHATAQILADLKAPRREDAESAQRSFNTRLFLCLAQDWDQRHREIARQLDKVESESKAMLAQLQFPTAPDTSNSTPNPPVSLGKSPDFMLSERLNAWSQLFFADRQDRPLLLTTNGSIIADLIAGSDPALVLMQLKVEDFPSSGEPAADSQALLAARIEKVRQQTWPFERQLVPAAAGEAEAADLTLYLFPNQSLRSLVAYLAGSRASGRIQPNRGGTTAKHAVVGLLRPGQTWPIQGGHPFEK